MHTLSEFFQLLRDRINVSPMPAAVIFNSHITGLAVARSLGRRGIPVIALDRDPAGYALVSKYVTAATLCPNVLEDETGFIDFLISVGCALKQPGVLFPCNDEWVLAVNRHRAALEPYFLIPFSGPDQDFTTMSHLEREISLRDYSVSNRGLRPDLVGTPAQIVERLHAFADVGIDLFLIQCSPMREELERIGTQVLPFLRREGSGA